MSELVERLRVFAQGEIGTEHNLSDLDKAADRIEELEQADKDAKHDIERLYESCNFELRRADKAEAQLKSIGGMCREISDDYAPDQVPFPEQALIEYVEKILKTTEVIEETK